MRKLLHISLLLQTFILLFVCFGFSQTLKVTTTDIVLAACPKNVAVLQASDFVAVAPEVATISALGHSGGHVMHTLLGEIEVEKEVLNSEISQTARYIVVFFSAYANREHHAISPLESEDSIFAALCLKTWQPTLQVFRL